MSATAYVDLSAFEHNVSAIVREVSPAETWIALKSNAYGHGMLELADNALRAGATGLAVLDIPAALRLRSHGIASTIFAWLHGAETDFGAAVAAGIDIGVSTRAQLDAVATAPGVGRVHLKIDTGLHRNGFSSSDWAEICAHARELEVAGSITVVGVWSHLADAGDESDDAALARFENARAAATGAGLAPELFHIAASSAALRNSRARNSVVRVGIAAYGISPFDDVDGHNLGLKPVIRLESTVLSSGTGQSVIAAGWFDGVPQQPDAEAWVAIDGGRAAVLTVGPRHTLIAGEFAAGSTVVVWGADGPTAEAWAAWTNTIGDEIVTGVPAHVRRVFGRG